MNKEYSYAFTKNVFKILFLSTHLGWPSGIGLGLGSAPPRCLRFDLGGLI